MQKQKSKIKVLLDSRFASSFRCESLRAKLPSSLLMTTKSPLFPPQKRIEEERRTVNSTRWRNESVTHSSSVFQHERKYELPIQVGFTRWKQETCMSAWSIKSWVICFPLSLHKLVGQYGDETKTWDLVVMKRWGFLSVEGKLGPSHNLHIHHDYCCYLLCSLTSPNINNSPSVRSVDVKKYSSRSFSIWRPFQTNQMLVNPTTNWIALF